MANSEWISPRKLMDYFMDQSDGMEATQKRLYLAVIKGEVRARLKGRVGLHRRRLGYRSRQPTVGAIIG
jgi:hypothetical protein